MLPSANGSTAGNLVVVDRLFALSVSAEVVILVVYCAGLSAKARSLGAILVGSAGGGTFTAARGMGNLESLGIPDT